MLAAVEKGQPRRFGREFGRLDGAGSRRVGIVPFIRKGAFRMAVEAMDKDYTADRRRVSSGWRGGYRQARMTRRTGTSDRYSLEPGILWLVQHGQPCQLNHRGFARARGSCAFHVWADEGTSATRLVMVSPLLRKVNTQGSGGQHLLAGAALPRGSLTCRPELPRSAHSHCPRPPHIAMVCVASHKSSSQSAYGAKYMLSNTDLTMLGNFSKQTNDC
jgi:hypothetical protein